MKRRKTYTCVFVIDEKKRSILLGFKKRGLLEGKWNGFGGKVEPGETILEAASRELEEECGLKSDNMIENGLLTVEAEDDTIISDVYLFTSTKFKGDVTESNEMMPKWFAIKDIPYEKMCPDDRFWLPLILEGKRFDAYFRYDKNGVILQHTIDVRN